MGENETISLIIKDAFSGQPYATVLPRNLTVSDAINRLAAKLGLPLMDDNMNKRDFTLKRMSPETKLQNDQVLSEVLQDGETIEFYEENAAGIFENPSMRSGFSLLQPSRR